MCRLLAYASPHDHAIEGLLSQAEFAEFTAMSKLHADGWGMAWLPGSETGQETHLGSTRSALRALDDPNYERFSATPMGRAGLLHIRRATPGFPAREENSHPFRVNGWAFAHNGAIPHAERLDALLSEETKQLLDADTDSKRYFLLVLQRIEETGDVVKGIRQAISDIREHCHLGSLNCVLMNEDVIVVIQAQGEAIPPIEVLTKAAGGASNLPEGHDENYYRLRYCVRGDALIVTSTGITSPGWNHVDEDSLFFVDLSTNQATITPLSSMTPSAMLTLSN